MTSLQKSVLIFLSANQTKWETCLSVGHSTVLLTQTPQKTKKLSQHSNNVPNVEIWHLWHLNSWHKQKKKRTDLYFPVWSSTAFQGKKREHPRLTELQLRGNPFKASQQFYKKNRFLFVSQCLKKEQKFWVEKGRKSAQKYILGFFSLSL